MGESQNISARWSLISENADLKTQSGMSHIEGSEEENNQFKEKRIREQVKIKPGTRPP